MKSPPELWAELSELESLARHLGEFGEIRITQVDPESRVEWEADRASGTVRLEPSGWGTRVVLTVDTPQPDVGAPEPVAGDPAPVAADPAPVVSEREPSVVDPAPRPVAAEPDRSAVDRAPQPMAVREAEPVATESQRAAAEPVATEPENDPVAAEPEPPVKRGWFARLFRRSARSAPTAAATSSRSLSVAEAARAAHEDALVDAEPIAAVPEEPVVEDPAPIPPDRAFGTIEWETPEPPVEEEPEPAPLHPDEAHAVLTGVLDTLGAAHHRPFSRP